MDAALLTTVEQLSDDAAGHRGAAAWPAGSAVASPQSGQAALSRALSDDGRNGQVDDLDHKDSMPAAINNREPGQSDPPAAAWQTQPQGEFLDWSSSLASQHLSDEAPGVFTITDRKVRGGDDPFDIPIYTLCRRWVRNDPYNNEAPVAEAAGTSELLSLPEPLPIQAVQDSPHPIEGPLPTTSDGEADTEYLLEHHMTHWLKVKEHHLKKIRRKQDRYKERLRLLLQRTHPGMSAEQPARLEGLATTSSKA